MELEVEVEVEQQVEVDEVVEWDRDHVKDRSAVDSDRGDHHLPLLLGDQALVCTFP